MTKETLAQPEPCCYGGIAHDCHAGEGCRIAERMKAAQKPPQRKPLTDEEIETYRYMIDWTAHWSYINFARAIEAAHGIKENT